MTHTDDDRTAFGEAAMTFEEDMFGDEKLEIERQWSNLASNIPGFVHVYCLSEDRKPSILFASAGLYDIYGLRVEDVMKNAMRLMDTVHPDDRALIEAATLDSAETLRPIQIEFRILHKEKGELWAETRAVPEPKTDGSVVWYGVTVDITSHKRTEDMLRHREQEFRTLVNNSPDVVVRYDDQCRRIYVSPSYESTVQSPVALILGKTPLERWELAVPPAATFQNLLRHVLTTGETREIELESHRSDGTCAFLSVRAVAERDKAGNIVSILTMGREITAIRQIQESLYKREQQFRTLVEHSPDTIARYDRSCRRIFANAKLVADMGGDLDKILGTTPSQFPGGPSAKQYEEALHHVLEHGEGKTFELRWDNDGQTFCAQVRMTPEFSRSGEVAHVLAVGRDITEIDEYRKKIHYQAFFDSLTDLPNRQLLNDRISQAIADASYHRQQFGLMLLDLDNFKEVNDTLGHSSGDRLLCEMSKRMVECVRSYDTVARLGGDEFAVLLPDLRKGDDLATIANKILQEMARPFHIDEHELFVTVSIGIALFPDDSDTLDTLFRYADSAMYHAKKMGRNNFQFYTKEFTMRSIDRMDIEAGLRKCLRNNELTLFFQPQVELQTGTIVGAEALLRWTRPEHGMVTPDRFIPVAEDSGLIVTIGEWVLRNACATVVEWNRERAQPLKLAVNLSTRQFIRNDLVGSIKRILEETACKPEWLELEITESLLLEDSEEVATMLNALHDFGLSIAIDDFGTGYSALSYLNRFPVGQLKIDRSFIRDIPHQRNKNELVKAMLSITTALHLESVAEGVETMEQAEYLLAQGCRFAQGYLFGKPMPRVAFETMLASGNVLAPEQ
jgi:diguanylate cyclase (GGDEF)-like protein/PAS domain S-box-containing protein